jgi:hypothetical protein
MRNCLILKADSAWNNLLVDEWHIGGCNLSVDKIYISDMEARIASEMSKIFSLYKYYGTEDKFVFVEN